MELVRATRDHLPSYVAALQNGWSADNVRGAAAAQEELARIEAEARALGLEYVEMTTDPDNIASQRVMLACGAVFVGRFQKPAQYGGVGGLRYRVYL